MGNSIATPALCPRPDYVHKLNDSVYELYHRGGVPKLEVIFFHGLQRSNYREAFWSTWLSRDGTMVWPKDWLGPSLQSARILSVSYGSWISAESPLDLHHIVEKLMEDLVINSIIDETRSIILVGHSLGGLIIKALFLAISRTIGLLSSDDRTRRKLEKFIESCCGIFYYSTPHIGSNLPEYVQLQSRLPLAAPDRSILLFFHVLCTETARINKDFSNLRHTRMLRATTTLSMAESLPTSIAGVKGLVVSQGSARYDVDQFYTVRADHYDVARPENMDSLSYTALLDFCLKFVSLWRTETDFQSIGTSGLEGSEEGPLDRSIPRRRKRDYYSFI